MIGVIAQEIDYPVVREFFELFKTPWEFYREGQRYEVVLCTADRQVRDIDAGLLIVYGTQEFRLDAEFGFAARAERSAANILYGGRELPIYGKIACFGKDEKAALRSSTGSAVIREASLGHGSAVVRVGYDLIREVSSLLSEGQPAANASIPTLDLHIEILRQEIVSRGLPLLEVLPSPAGHSLIVCLTHDIDHPSIRNHKFDHTMFGFLFRALIGTVKDYGRGRVPFRYVVRNWAAAAKLPFVYLGVARDFWKDFDQYADLGGGADTYFFIPFKGHPGSTDQGPAPSARAAGYGAAEFKETMAKLTANHAEIAVHGLDCWRDAERGAEEFRTLRKVSGRHVSGVRMHWLYFGKNSPTVLEQAGAGYDSTVGYNETVGFRAGTAQAFKPLEVQKLLELPMHVMDTALFYPAYLDLTTAEATDRVEQVVRDVERFGGCLTINWHDRSIAPERLWGDFYVAMVSGLKKKNPWFATAGDAVSWFRKRRSVIFEKSEDGQLRIKVRDLRSEKLPSLNVRIYNSDEERSGSFSEFTLEQSLDFSAFQTSILPDQKISQRV